MNEDYLWDKTGEDPEIEKLENALAVFRYKEIAPIELPAKVLPFAKKETPRNFFRYAYAAAACAAFVFVSLGIWFQFSGNKPELAGNVSGTFKPQVIIETPEKSVEPIGEETEAPKQFARRKIVKVRKIAPVIAKNIVTEKPAVELTEEEKYAYNQLMLALSITGSKLRLVTDKIEGTEKQNAVNKDGQ